MNELNPSELASFARKYRFAGGKLRSVRVRHRGGRAAVEVVLAVRTAIRDLGEGPAPVRLRLRLSDVDEYRFQKRLGVTAGKVPDVQFGHFNGLFYVTFDAWPLGPGERPAVHDFRGSDAFAAGRVLAWEEAQGERGA
jgi:hypothetical protein